MVQQHSSLFIEIEKCGTQADLALLLDRLRRQRGMSYDNMERAARALRNKPGHAHLEPLARSTIGEIVTGRRVPTINKLRMFLLTCEVPLADIPLWLAARERILGTLVAATEPMLKVGAARPRELGVHASIRTNEDDTELPPYVLRDVDGPLRSALTDGAKHGCFLLLVGGSSVGKTRTMYEAIKAVVPGWSIVHPDPRSKELPRALTGEKPKRVVVWLDELQLYLGRNGVLSSPETLRKLLRAKVILVGTIWPDEYAVRAFPQSIRESARASSDGESSTSRNNDVSDRAVLDLAQVFDLSAELTSAELARAQSHAQQDSRIRLSLDSADGSMTEVLAAGPALERWWMQAPPYAWAVITAAIDARRLGVTEAISVEMLAAAAPGYLQAHLRARAPKEWLDTALRYATRPLHGATSTLVPASNGSMGEVAGYIAADYLLQRARKSRRTICPPATFWESLQQHLRSGPDIGRLAYNAEQRLRFVYAAPLYARIADRDNWYAAKRLADLQAMAGDIQGAVHTLLSPNIIQALAITHTPDLLVDLGHIDSAIHVLETYAAIGSRLASTRLANLLVTHLRIDLLRQRANAGDGFAAERLAAHLVHQGELNEVESRAMSGDAFCIEQLRILGESAESVPQHVPDVVKGKQIGLTVPGNANEQIADLATRASGGDWKAKHELLDLLAREQKYQDLRSYADAGDGHAKQLLADWLIGLGQVNEARELLAHHPGEVFTNLLAQHNHLEALRLEIDAGTEKAGEHLIRGLRQRGGRFAYEADQIQKFGLSADGSISVHASKPPKT